MGEPFTCELLALFFVPGGGPSLVRGLLRRFECDPEDLLTYASSLLSGLHGLTAAEGRFLKRLGGDSLSEAMRHADAQLHAAGHLGAEVITYLDERYPANLAESEHSPLVLFVRGHIDLSDRDAVAVVGTRQASFEGDRRARQLARILAESGITVVSGLARGIDTAAHEATIQAGGRTIAVVGCGLDRTYPSENAALADRIAETGAVVSQFPIGTPPGKRNFPMRNKTMAHLSRATVVIEAGEQSGAKMQADFALNHQDPQRHVFLTRSLVDAQPADGWASRFIARGARVLAREGDLLSLFPGKRPPSPQQLGFGF